MKSSDIIISVIVTLSTLSPIVYLYYHSKTQYFKVFKSIKTYIETHNFSMNDFEIWDNKGLAIDIEKRILVYSDQFIESTPVTFIDLNNIRSIDLSASKFEILIEMKSKRGHSTIITMFDSLKDDPFQKGFYMEIAKKWVQKLRFFIVDDYKLIPPKAA